MAKKIVWSKWNQLPPGKPVFTRKDTVDFVDGLARSYEMGARRLKEEHRKEKIIYMIKDKSIFSYHKVRFYLVVANDETIEELKKKHRRWEIFTV